MSARRRSCSTSSWSPRKESDALGDGSKKTDAESKRTHSADNLSQSEGAGAPESNKPDSPHKPRERERESESERESENLAGEDEPYELFQVPLHAFVRLFMCLRRCLSMHSSFVGVFTCLDLLRLLVTNLKCLPVLNTALIEPYKSLTRSLLEPE